MSRLEVIRQIGREARALYARKEAELPVQVGLTPLPPRAVAELAPARATTATAWPTGRPSGSACRVDPEVLRNKLRPEIEVYLNDLAHREYAGRPAGRALEARVDAAYGPPAADGKPAAAPDAKAVADLVGWATADPRRRAHATTS